MHTQVALTVSRERQRDSCRPGLLSSPNEEGRSGVEQVVNKEGMHNRVCVCVSGIFLNVNKIYVMGVRAGVCLIKYDL